MINKLLPQPAKNSLKRALRYFKREHVRLTDGFTLADLEARLREIGLGSGDVVMVHIGMKHLKGINGTPEDVIDLLLDIIGKEGTLMMPSMPFQTTLWHYVTSDEVTDLRTSPSAMGLVTELYRQRPGVARSSHPTHPILSFGPATHELLKDHSKSATPCGKHSPFHKLHQINGKILLLGTGIYTNTFYHYLEEVFEQGLPSGVLSREPFNIPFIDRDGRERAVTNRIFDPHFSRIRDVGLLEEQLRNDGFWHEAFIGRLQAVRLNSEECHESMRRMVERGEHCYVRDLAPNDDYPMISN